MFNNLIFDFDNTLYDYSHCYNEALNTVFIYLQEKLKINIEDIKYQFQQQKKIIQNSINNQASSHNKCIQFKKIVEFYHLPVEEAIVLYDLFIDNFNKHLKLYDYVEDFLKICIDNNIKCFLLTNNICYEQLFRLKKLNLCKYFTKIYTSEELGTEKPDPKIFNTILQENNIQKNEVAMIGDSFNMDIESVNLLNIYGFWFQNKLNNNICLDFKENYCIFSKYSTLITFFKEYYYEASKFIKLSTFCGERYDLVQAGGGNISFKINDFLFIKSSGCLLSDMDYNKNYVGLCRNTILNNLDFIKNENKKSREKEAKNIVDSSIYFLKNYKPSIETTMHSLTKKYTVHLHPLQFLKICALDNCEALLKEHFKHFCFIEYFTPGIDVALELKKKYLDVNHESHESHESHENHENNKDIIFLKNHGIVLTKNTIEELYLLLEEVINILEKLIQLDFKKYKLTNYISKLMNTITNENTISFVCDDSLIINLYNHIINLKPYFPDKLVYCGTELVILEYIYEKDIDLIKNYMKMNSEIPKIFYLQENIYINSNSLKKCIEIESLLKSHLLCYNENNIILSEQENNYLNNWDAEKFRKKI